MPTHSQALLDRIVVSRDVCHGKPRIAGTRIMVHRVLDLLAAGTTIPEITSEDYYPELTPEDVLACLRYANRIIEDDTIVPTA